MPVFQFTQCFPVYLNACCKILEVTEIKQDIEKIWVNPLRANATKWSNIGKHSLATADELFRCA